MYCIMLPDSKRRIGLPSSNVSVIHGILFLTLIPQAVKSIGEIVADLPLGFISRNHGSFCVFLAISILWTLYGSLTAVSVRHEAKLGLNSYPSSSRSIVILMPLGV